MQPNPIVAYRHRYGKSFTGADFEIVCIECRQPEDRSIVLRSESGQHVKNGRIRCNECKQAILVF